MTAPIKEWVCTDPDNLQYRSNSNKQHCYVFRQFDNINYPYAKSILDRLEIESAKAKIIKELWETPDFWIQATIDLDDYNQHEKECAAFDFGYEKLRDIQPEILAECLFELNITEFM